MVEKDVAEVVVEKVVAGRRRRREEEEEGTRSSKYPNQYWRHPCEYHRLCVREKRNSQLKGGTKPPVEIRLHRRGELVFSRIIRVTSGIFRDGVGSSFSKTRHHLYLLLLFYFCHLTREVRSAVDFRDNARNRNRRLRAVSA